MLSAPFFSPALTQFKIVATAGLLLLLASLPSVFLIFLLKKMHNLSQYAFFPRRGYLSMCQNMFLFCLLSAPTHSHFIWLGQF